eukprot:11326131-Alexandrium_andersonii.AAC.1
MSVVCAVVIRRCGGSCHGWRRPGPGRSNRSSGQGRVRASGRRCGWLSVFSAGGVGTPGVQCP